MNSIVSTSPGYSAAAALDLGRAPRRAVAESTGSAETPAVNPTARIEAENRAAALGSIDDLAGAEAAVAAMRLILTAQPAEARAAQGAPSPEKSLRLLGV